MKKYLVYALLSLSLFLSACHQSAESKAGQVMFTLQNGSQTSLKSLAGKWVVINFWASWCKPCYQEIPALNAFAKNHAANVVVFGVSYDHAPADQLAGIIQKMNIQFPTLTSDPSRVLGVDNIKGLPATLIINPAGKLVETLYGEQTEASLAKAIA